jgi:hypothetical protein
VVASVNRLTESGARIMVQILCRTFVERTPAWEEPHEYVARQLVLQKGMARLIGAMPTAEDITELITTYEELDSLDAGTHPDIRTNLAATTNNIPDILDFLLQRVERETTELLNNAGYGKAAA